MRTRRVGSITCGLAMVFFGILFLVHMFFPALSFRMILKLWPLILILLGGEMLVSNGKGTEGGEALRYDKGAVCLVFLMACFAAAMGILEYCMEHWPCVLR